MVAHCDNHLGKANTYPDGNSNTYDLIHFHQSFKGVKEMARRHCRAIQGLFAGDTTRLALQAMA
jgi:hypothetical protein